MQWSQNLFAYYRCGICSKPGNIPGEFGKAFLAASPSIMLPGQSPLLLKLRQHMGVIQASHSIPRYCF